MEDRKEGEEERRAKTSLIDKHNNTNIAGMSKEPGWCPR